MSVFDAPDRCSFPPLLREPEIDRYIQGHYPGEEFGRMVELQKRRLLQSKTIDFSRWTTEAFDQYAAAHVRREVSCNVKLPTFEEYLTSNQAQPPRA